MTRHEREKFRRQAGPRRGARPAGGAAAEQGGGLHEKGAQSGGRAVCIPAGIALTAGGLVGFLPIVGFWMVPLGLAALAQDVPVMRPPLARLLRKVNGKRKPPDLTPQ